MRRVSLFLLVVFVVTAIGTSSSMAIENSEDLGTFGVKGAAAGQLDEPRGLSTDPVTGHVLVADFGNNRIDEFTPWGDFVKAFGWDVAPGPVNEEQELRVRAGAGQFRLTFDGDSTGDLSFDASALEVETALNALPSIGTGGTSVESRWGTVDGTTPFVYVIAFDGSALDQEDVQSIVVSNGTVPLSGGVPSTSMEVRTRASGGPGGAGLESCTAASGCKKGTAGSGAGQMFGPLATAIDANGDVYVTDQVNRRVQKFNSAGEFLLMFGGEVNKTSSANICTQVQLVGGDVCGAGVSGSGPGFFESAAFTAYIGLGPTGTVYLGDIGRVESFNPDGTFKAEFAAPGGTVARLAVDPQGNGIYLVGFGAGEVRKVSTSGVPIGAPYPIPAPHRESLAVDSAGNLYVVEVGTPSGPDASISNVRQFDPNGIPLTPASCCVPDPLPGEPEDSFLRFSMMGLGASANGNLYISHRGPTGETFIRLLGPPPLNFESPPQVPPTISAQYAIDVGSDEAALGAEINPHFFSDTTLYVEYGTEDCDVGSCAKEPAPPGGPLGGGPTSKSVKSPPVSLSGLTPGTTYHYRFVAQSGGGGPVVGADRTFRTFSAGEEGDECLANQGFRTGPSSLLPDCRAYEMVSPVDKGGNNILAVIDITGFNTALEQSAANGEAMTYSSLSAFADPKAGPYVSQYIATRLAGDTWSTQSLQAARGPGFYTTKNSLENEFKAFTPDLCGAWLVHEADPPLSNGAVEGFPNAYRRDNCGSPAYAALTPVEPTNVTSDNYVPEPQGYTSDGKRALIRVNEKLTGNATEGVYQVYEANGGDGGVPASLALVCILPNGVPYTGNCSAGTGPTGGSTSQNRTATVQNAMSEDGSRIYWTASGVPSSGPGKIYLRVNGAETRQVSETKTTAEARFWGASPNGSKALWQVDDQVAPISALDGNLYIYSPGPGAGSGESTLLASKVLGVAGASDDLSRVYFVSEEAIGGKGSAGKPNLYLASGGSTTFIATLAALDVDTGTPKINSVVNPEPLYHAAQASAEGGVLAFISTASLTGYDNTDAATGEPDSEIYLYDADADQLFCASCNPSGARPLGEEVFAPGNGGSLATAATLPTAEYQLHNPRVLSSDGGRLFFESYDALLPGDENENADVYEWEAPGAGTCTESSSAFSPDNSGCIYLISGGTGSRDAGFADADESGDNVFFTTAENLVEQDKALIDVYVARVNGGLPSPAIPPEPCEPESCPGPPSPPPPAPAPASPTWSGPGNQKPLKCPKGKHKVIGKKGKSKCVKDKPKHKKKGTSKRAGTNPGVGR